MRGFPHSHYQHGQRWTLSEGLKYSLARVCTPQLPFTAVTTCINPSPWYSFKYFLVIRQRQISSTQYFRDLRLFRAPKDSRRLGTNVSMLIQPVESSLSDKLLFDWSISGYFLPFYYIFTLCESLSHRYKQTVQNAENASVEHLACCAEKLMFQRKTVRHHTLNNRRSESMFCPLQAVWPWAKHFTAVSPPVFTSVKWG